MREPGPFALLAIPNCWNLFVVRMSTAVLHSILATVVKRFLSYNHTSEKRGILFRQEHQWHQWSTSSMSWLSPRKTTCFSSKHLARLNGTNVDTKTRLLRCYTRLKLERGFRQTKLSCTSNWARHSVSWFQDTELHGVLFSHDYIRIW